MAPKCIQLFYKLAVAALFRSLPNLPLSDLQYSDIKHHISILWKSPTLRRKFSEWLSHFLTLFSFTLFPYGCFPLRIQNHLDLECSEESDPESCNMDRALAISSLYTFLSVEKFLLLLCFSLSADITSLCHKPPPPYLGNGMFLRIISL